MNVLDPLLVPVQMKTIKQLAQGVRTKPKTLQTNCSGIYS